MEIYMVTKKVRTYSRYTKDAVNLLGKFIQLARKSRRLTESDFSDRIGISRTTLQKIEKGDLKCELGIAFEAASLLGIKLFDVDPNSTFKMQLEGADDKLALLPKSIRTRKSKVDDDF